MGKDLNREFNLTEKHFDVLIIGGGVMGASIAYHLLNDGLDGTVGIIEKDSSYELASAPRSVRCIRQQFSTEVYIKACLYSIAAFERFDEEMALDGEPDHCEYRATGYLMLGDENNWETLKRQYPLQRSLDVAVEIVTPEDLLKLYPHFIPK